LTPAGILWAIGLPSLRLLYIMDEVLDAEITVKAIGKIDCLNSRKNPKYFNNY
jgi:hypothetical protein